MKNIVNTFFLEFFTDEKCNITKNVENQFVSLIYKVTIAFITFVRSIQNWPFR